MQCNEIGPSSQRSGDETYWNSWHPVRAPVAVVEAVFPPSGRDGVRVHVDFLHPFREEAIFCFQQRNFASGSPAGVYFFIYIFVFCWRR